MTDLLISIIGEGDMKKGLSILLIAAALFGFYGGAVNLNDVLACKDYWEETGEKSTADMNKLEDGLNQLKDNEEAYLQGLKDIVDGEKALADGEKAYADGQATLAQGEADYAAAPGKLAAGEKALAEGKAKLAAGYKAYAEGKESLAAGKAKVAAGEEALEDGYESLASLNKLIDGLESAKDAFDTQWQPGFENKVPEAESPGLKQARGIISNTLNPADEEAKKSIQASVQLIESLAGTSGLIENINNADSYAEFDNAVVDLADAFGKAATVLTELKKTAETYAEDTDDTKALKAGLKDSTVPPGITKKISELNLAETKQVLSAAKQSLENGKKELVAGKAQLEQGKQLLAGLKQAKEQGAQTVEQAGTQIAAAASQLGMPGATPIDTAIAAVQKSVNDGQDKVNAGEKQVSAGEDSVSNLEALIQGRETAQTTVAGFASQSGDKLSMAGSLDERLGQLSAAIPVLAGQQDVPNEKYADTYQQLQNGLSVLAGVLGQKVEDIKTNKATFEAWDSGYQQLKAAQDQIADASSGIPFAFQNILNNSTIRPVFDANAPESLMGALKLYGLTSKLAKDDLDDFDSDMNTISKQVIPGALQILGAVKTEAQKQLNKGESDLAAGKQAVSDGEKALAAAAKKLAAGEKELAAGKAELAQGYADYKAAPAKLAEGRAALAEGLQTIMDGRAALAAGKEKLAEYEDGEQQVRDGLATLMATEADGGLTSILERRSGDADFDNGDTHLELDEGLEAVTVGRGYQSDSGELITKEITNRAIGTAAGLGAGALAVLAAILSLLKKNKGAGISAILAAAAGGAGVAMGTSAGMEFSSIAGSLVGATPWVAFGILAAVAAVFAVAHLAGKKEA